MTVDREKAAMMGADVASVGSSVQLMTNGVLIGRFRPDDAEDEIDIRLRYPESARGFPNWTNCEWQPERDKVRLVVS